MDTRFPIFHPCKFCFSGAVGRAPISMLLANSRRRRECHCADLWARAEGIQALDRYAREPLAEAGVNLRCRLDRGKWSSPSALAKSLARAHLRLRPGCDGL